MSFDDDVHPAVVEHLQHLHDGRAGTDLAPSLAVLEHEPELVALGEALADQLLVAGLEDMERHALGRQEHERQWKQADLRHGREA